MRSGALPGRMKMLVDTPSVVCRLNGQAISLGGRLLYDARQIGKK